MLDALLDICDVKDERFAIAAPILQHIELLHKHCRGWTEIAMIDGVPSKARRRMISLWAECSDKAKQAENALRAAKGNLLGYGAYIGMCTRREEKTQFERGKIEDALGITALWCDLDKEDPTPLLDFIPAASIVLETGGGYHGLWMLSEAPHMPHDIHKMTMRGIAGAIGADTSVCEFSRVLRLLGSINTKPDRNGARCKILRWEPDWTHTIKSFAHLIETSKPKLPRATERTIERADMPNWVKEYMEAPPAQGERNSTLFRMAGSLNDHGWGVVEAIETLRGFAGLADREVERTIESAFKLPRRGEVLRGRDNLRAAARI